MRTGEFSRACPLSLWERAGVRAVAVFAIAALCSGCAFFENREERALDSDFARSDRSARESRTVSSLAFIEKSLDDYVQHERKIPDRLDLLVPTYAPEIPVADAGVGGHGASNRVTYYPSSVIRDGVVDGTRLKDTGYWGYVANDRQIIIFVDCTHKNSHGRAWYQEPGTAQWNR